LGFFYSYIFISLLLCILQFDNWNMAKAIFISWSIALPEYCLQVPANRIAHVSEGGPFSAPQLKVIAEVCSLTTFAIFSSLVLKEKLRWVDLGAFALILAGVLLSLLTKPATTVPPTPPPPIVVTEPPPPLPTAANVQTASPVSAAGGRKLMINSEIVHAHAGRDALPSGAIVRITETATADGNLRQEPQPAPQI
jgi:uncharacterized protein